MPARQKYSDEFKARVLARVKAGESKSSIARELGFANCALISRWERDAEVVSLRAENARLRALIAED